MKVILASASPRRAEILRMIGINFTVCPADIDEDICCGDPARLTEIISEKKALAVSGRVGENDNFIIAADTVVAIDGLILGKPKSQSQAAHMLLMLSGKRHAVFTGVCMKYMDKTVIFHEKSEVEFCQMSDEEILSYISSGEPMDKAGAYGIQGLGSKYVKGIVGDFFNVMGFPVNSFYRHTVDMDMDLAGKLFKL